MNRQEEVEDAAGDNPAEYAGAGVQSLNIPFPPSVRETDVVVFAHIVSARDNGRTVFRHWHSCSQNPNIGISAYDHQNRRTYRIDYRCCRYNPVLPAPVTRLPSAIHTVARVCRMGDFDWQQEANNHDHPLPITKPLKAWEYFGLPRPSASPPQDGCANVTK